MLAFDPLSWQAFGDHHPQSIILPGWKARERGLLWINSLNAGEPYRWTVVGDNQPSHCFVIFDEVLCGSWWLLGLVCTLLSSQALVRVMSYGLNEWIRLDLSTCIYLACVSGCLQPSSIILHDALMWFDGRSVCLCGPGWKAWPRLMSRVIRSELLNPPFSLFIFSHQALREIKQSAGCHEQWSYDRISHPTIMTEQLLFISRAVNSSLIMHGTHALTNLTVCFNNLVSQLRFLSNM